MDAYNLFESLFRWIHVVAGVLWIGLLYFFNFVNSGFAPTMDGETKKKVVPELMPRTLYFFRWGAAYTWVTGLLLAFMVFWNTGVAWDDGVPTWDVGSIVMILVTLLGFLVYDVLAKGPLKDNKKMFWGGFVLATAAVLLYDFFAGFSPRGYMIHLGALFGTTMAFNVWFRIWPAQRQIITAVKGGTAPDAALVAQAGQRSKHNTYMSVPLIFAMLNTHNTWAFSSVIILPLVILVGWAITFQLYKHAATVKGF